MRNIIGWPAPKLQNTGKIHGSALGEEEVAATKTALGIDPAKSFDVASEVIQHTRLVSKRGQEVHAKWNDQLATWRKSNPEGSTLLDRLVSGKLPAGYEKVIPKFEAGKEVATRKASGDVINAIASVVPEFWGGSADLGESNLTTKIGRAHV